MEISIDSVVQRWSGLERPLFKGKLIDPDGCKCAQGDVLSCAGFSDDDLRVMDQYKADYETARLLGISLTHSILLRQVNDQQDGAPQVVLTEPSKVLGPNADLVLGLWLFFDALTPEQLMEINREAWAAREAREAREAWEAREAREARAAWAAREARAAWEAWAAWKAWEAREARAAWEAGEAWAAWEAREARAARAASIYASVELIGMEKLEAKNEQPYFLAFFGFDTWDKARELSTLHPWRLAAKSPWRGEGL